MAHGSGLAIALGPVTLGIVTLLGMVTAGAPVYQRAWRAARHGSTNMHTLVALGTFAAFGYSAVATFWPELLTRHHIRPDLYYDSVLFILGFLLLGNWLETRARKRALDAVRTLAELEPAQAHILKEGRELACPRPPFSRRTSSSCGLESASRSTASCCAAPPASTSHC